MNNRDLVDWIVIGASILSSLGILGTIGVYFWQKNDSNKLNKKAIQSILSILNEAVMFNNAFIDSIKENKDDIIFHMEEASDISPVTEADISFMLTINNIIYMHLYKLTSNNLSVILPNIYNVDYFLFQKINYYIINISIANNKTKTSLYSKRSSIEKFYNIQEGLTLFTEKQKEIITSIRDSGYKI
ncbi:hypothetical protein [Proteus terrae]|uniref:hypothetical protein n=1 Tax=Proteus terrae TaxID=1574161 RepID=UPI003523A9D0